MKSFLMPLMAAFALTVGTAAAQTTTQTAPANGSQDGRGYGRSQGTPEEMASRQSQRMAQELGLSADQTTRVQQILLARSQERQAMRGQGRGATNRDQMRTQMEANRTKYDNQFKEVLTTDQYTKYTATQADRMQRGGGPGRGFGQGDGVEKVKIKGDKVKVKGTKADKEAAKSARKANK
ncbi:hypothetical protein [Hymenobacter sp. B1770]|uniref:hypothetical protein n=1 Tax=Hymenobacter sp. B1770 TaxID=1718788 RepID=UPI003CEBEFCC